MAESGKSRRELLAGYHAAAGHDGPPSAGPTLRIAVRAMACEFGAAVNAGRMDDLTRCGKALEIVPEIELWMSVYRPDSVLSRLNNHATGAPVAVTPEVVKFLRLAADIFRDTGGAFDMASGAQIELWRNCRAEERIPTADEVRQAVAASGMQHVEFPDPESVRLTRPGLRLDPGAIGKGFALDQVLECLMRAGQGPGNYLLHGGQSSLVARGEHNGMPGWPVGIGNPLLTNRRLGTLILRNQAMSTSGSNIQFFRSGGRRFGHILDPRTGWPVEGMLSVVVVADSAAVADAVSTAFFVLGVEKARECCDNFHGVGAILIPFPERGARVRPVVIGMSPDQIFWDPNQVQTDGPTGEATSRSFGS